MKLVVGLGNPGKEYVGTRHNIGFEVVDAFAARNGWIPSASDFRRLAKEKFEALALDGAMRLSAGGTEKVLLLELLTYMNLSGRSVQAALAFYQLEPKDLLVVLDDVALPCGKLRIRAGGSSGGHNGLKDIERALGTSQYPRLRVGVDPPPPRVPQRDWVLGKFSPDQRQQIDPAIARACGAIAVWIDQGVTLAMTQFNGEEENPKSETNPKRKQESPKRDAS
jgi:PTH1 family peptidyl-tRNA hydrolase